MASPKEPHYAGRVLSVASECVPFVKTGGLADVVGALPASLAVEGWHVRTLIPAYKGLKRRLPGGKVVWKTNDLMGGPAKVLARKATKKDGGIEMLLLDAPHLFYRDGSIYLGPDGIDWPDNPQRFAALSQVAAAIAADGLSDGWRPNILHAHDWQAGLASTYLGYTKTKDVATILTVHNIAFQGIAPPMLLNELKLPSTDFTADGFEFWGNISALKAGLVASDVITTVSPTYVQELTVPEFGMGLDGLIRSKRDSLYGILNGVDEDVWNPAMDPEIAANYDVNCLDKKAANRVALAKEFKLKPGKGPIYAVVSRLTQQKGLDLLLQAIPNLLHRKGQLVVLGSGDVELEAGYMKAAKDHPGQVSVKIGYDEALSHRIFAGADVILVPSRFEPCGLTQLYGLRYGTLPLVARTGGLADTVIDANDAAVKAEFATGVQFSPVTADALISAINRMSDIYDNKALWKKFQTIAMNHPVGWQDSAKSYANLYTSLLK